LYDISNDYLETDPLRLEDLSAEEKEVYEMLNGVLQQYKTRRLEDIVIQN
jgi:hypothetical protein